MQQLTSYNDPRHPHPFESQLSHNLMFQSTASSTRTSSLSYLQVFRVSGTTAFLTYAGALPIGSIWFKRKWSATLRHMLDGLVYALLTAGCFGWLWP